MNFDFNKIFDGLNIKTSQETREKLHKVSQFINENFYNFLAVIFMASILIFFLRFWWLVLGFGGLYYLIKSEKVDLKELLRKIGITKQ